MCALGYMVSAEEAAESGIVDQLVEGDLLDGAIRFARETADSAPATPQNARHR